MPIRRNSMDNTEVPISICNDADKNSDSSPNVSVGYSQRSRGIVNGGGDENMEQFSNINGLDDVLGDLNWLNAMSYTGFPFFED